MNAAMTESFAELFEQSQAHIAKLKPVHVIMAGLVGAAVFVLALVLVGQWVVGSGVAA